LRIKFATETIYTNSFYAPLLKQVCCTLSLLPNAASLICDAFLQLAGSMASAEGVENGLLGMMDEHLAPADREGVAFTLVRAFMHQWIQCLTKAISCAAASCTYATSACLFCDLFGIL
jgi:hypothetical protein